MKICSGIPAAADLERIQGFLEQDEAANNLLALWDFAWEGHM